LSRESRTHSLALRKEEALSMPFIETQLLHEGRAFKA
jgi:hypothetical protein